MALAVTIRIRTTLGNKKIVFGSVVSSDTADEFTTSLNHVDHCSLTTRSTIATGGSDTQVVLNSNNGTVGTNAGDVWLDSETDAVVYDFMAIGY